MAKLLVVDDQEANRYLLEILLKGHGHAVALASNGVEALASARRDPPDLIITDILMPEMDGFALCRAWKSDPELSDIPLVFYTATYTSSKDEKFALSLGAERFIVKPTEPERFMQILGQVLEEQQKGMLLKTVAPPEEEGVFLREYNEVLIHKLEDKILQLEQANKLLMQEEEALKRTQRELARSEEKFSKAFMRSPASVVITTRADRQRYLEINEAFLHSSGYAREEVIGRARDEVGEWENPELYREALEVLDRQGFISNVELVRVNKSGTRSALLWSAESLELDGSPCILSTSVDITDRKNLESKLRRELQINQAYNRLASSLILPFSDLTEGADLICDYARSLTSSPHGYVSYLDRRTGDCVALTLTNMQPGACKIGLSSNELPVIFRRGPDGTYPGLWGHSLNTGEGFFTNAPAAHPSAAGCPSGHLPLERFISAPAILEGKVVGQIALANAPSDYGNEDLAVLARLADFWALTINRAFHREEAARLQRQLQQSQRLEAIGTLASGIAHDFNNLLTAISGYSELIAMEKDLKAETRQRAGIIREQIERASALVRQLLDFGRGSTREKSGLNLLAFVKETAKLLQRLIPENVEIDVTYGPGTYKMLGDPVSLQQILTNLVVNARDAMPEGGEISFHLEGFTLGPAQSPPAAGMKPGPWISLRVEDTGHGITAEDLPRVFEPFFTTKPEGKGTGMGMAQVYGLVQEHQGALDIESHPGKGTTISLYLPALPAADQEGKPPASSPTEQKLAGRHATILIVEDDPQVRMVLARQLEQRGHRVLTAENGRAALEVMREQGGDIDLVLTDVVMPIMGGKELYEELVAHHGQVKVIFMTGYSLGNEAARFLRTVKVPVLDKPVSMKELNKVIGETLGEAAG